MNDFELSTSCMVRHASCNPDQVKVMSVLTQPIPTIVLNLDNMSTYRTAIQSKQKNNNLLRGSFYFLLILVIIIVLLLSLCEVDVLRNSTYPVACMLLTDSYSEYQCSNHTPGINNSDPQNLVHTSNVKTILFWTGFYVKPASEWKVKMGDLNCGQYQCKLTYNHSNYRECDAFIFHLRCPSWVKDMKKLLDMGGRLPHQRWILYNRESAVWTKGKELEPASNYFNWTMGYRRDDTIYIPTAVVRKGKFQDGYNPSKNYLEGKPGQVAVLMSMCNWGEYIPRSNYIKLLKKSGLHLDVLGNCGKKCGSYEDCVKIMKTYKFVLAIENSLCNDYISEKAYINGFKAGIIPIVASKANVSDTAVFPPGSFINALQFPTTTALVEHINKVGSDPDLYNSYFKWRANWTFTMVSEKEGKMQFPDNYFCPLCEKLHIDTKSQSIPNLRKWYEQEKCYPFPDR